MFEIEEEIKDDISYYVKLYKFEVKNTELEEILQFLSTNYPGIKVEVCIPE